MKQAKVLVVRNNRLAQWRRRLRAFTYGVISSFAFGMPIAKADLSSTNTTAQGAKSDLSALSSGQQQPNTNPSTTGYVGAYGTATNTINTGVVGSTFFGAPSGIASSYTVNGGAYGTATNTINTGVVVGSIFGIGNDNSLGLIYINEGTLTETNLQSGATGVTGTSSTTVPGGQGSIQRVSNAKQQQDAKIAGGVANTKGGSVLNTGKAAVVQTSNSAVSGSNVQMTSTDRQDLAAAEKLGLDRALVAGQAATGSGAALSAQIAAGDANTAVAGSVAAPPPAADVPGGVVPPGPP